MTWSPDGGEARERACVAGDFDVVGYGDGGHGEGGEGEERGKGGGREVRLEISSRNTGYTVMEKGRKALK